jgi:hypothetical protein
VLFGKVYILRASYGAHTVLVRSFTLPSSFVACTDVTAEATEVSAAEAAVVEASAAVESAAAAGAAVKAAADALGARAALAA